MNIISPSVEMMREVDGRELLKHLEAVGRTCYQSGDRVSEGTAETFIKSIINRGHESILEHASVSMRFICDRGVSHEIVRHRLASYAQESTRYCNYSKGKFGEAITVIKPCYLVETSEAYMWWRAGCEVAERAYFDMLKAGCTAEQARAVLPSSLKTEVVMTANLREWRHFFKLRCAKPAHPQMREVALMALSEMRKAIPIVFDDLDKDENV